MHFTVCKFHLAEKSLKEKSGGGRERLHLSKRGIGQQRVNLPAGLKELEGRKSCFQEVLKLLLNRESGHKIHIWSLFFPQSQTKGDRGQTYKYL